MYDTNCIAVKDDIRSQVVANVHECYNLCKADASCGAFVYWGLHTSCYLKTICGDNFISASTGLDYYNLGKVNI